MVENSLLLPSPPTIYSERSSQSGPIKTLQHIFSPLKTFHQLLISFSVKLSLCKADTALYNPVLCSLSSLNFFLTGINLSVATASLQFLYDLSQKPASGPLNMQFPLPALLFLQMSMWSILIPSGLYSSVTFPIQPFPVPILKILSPFLLY